MHDSSISSRNLLDKLQLTEYLNAPGVTEVFINRPGEVFLEGEYGRIRYERPDLTLPVLEKLANTLCTFNKKHISYESRRRTRPHHDAAFLRRRHNGVCLP